MATATISESKKVESQRDRNLPVPPRALRIAARAFLRLARADVVWLAVRESRSQVAVVRCSEGARSTAGLGLAIESGVGVGGAVLAKSEPWWGKIGDHGATRLSDRESTILCDEGVRHLMAIPLLSTGSWGGARIEGVAYVGARRDVAWSERTVTAGQRVGRGGRAADHGGGRRDAAEDHNDVGTADRGRRRHRRGDRGPIQGDAGDGLLGEGCPDRRTACQGGGAAAGTRAAGRRACAAPGGSFGALASRRVADPEP